MATCLQHAGNKIIPYLKIFVLKSREFKVHVLWNIASRVRALVFEVMFHISKIDWTPCQ